MFIIIIVPLQVMKKNLHKKYQVVDILRTSRVQNFKAGFFFFWKNSFRATGVSFIL